MNKYKILHTSQSGFRKNHSCNTALINLLDKWLKNIDKGEITGAVFFDLRKPFDAADHHLLLKKVAAYKFSENSLSWIRHILQTENNASLKKLKGRPYKLSNPVFLEDRFSAQFSFCYLYTTCLYS